MTEAAAEIEISINGEDHRVPPDSTIAELLESLGLDCRHVAVEQNRHLVLKTDYDKTSLAAGDHLEIVTFVGGG